MGLLEALKKKVLSSTVKSSPIQNSTMKERESNRKTVDTTSVSAQRKVPHENSLKENAIISNPTGTTTPLHKSAFPSLTTPNVANKIHNHVSVQESTAKNLPRGVDAAPSKELSMADLARSIQDDLPIGRASKQNSLSERKESKSSAKILDVVSTPVAQDSPSIHSTPPVSDTELILEESTSLAEDSPFDMASIKLAIQSKLEKPTTNIVPDEDRLSTGIPGLDEVMAGGIRKQTAVLVGGGAGSGKSIFAMQFLVNGIQMANETGVYVSFEQTEEEILKDYTQFGWDLPGKIHNNQLTLLHHTPEQVEKVLESGGGVVRDVISSIGAKRIVIDSLTAFSLLFKSDFEKRRALLRLFETIRSWGCTTIVISEQEPDPEHHVSTVLEFAVDGVILLYNVRKGDIRERSLEVFKMRATDHQQKIFPMKINESGITIYPDEVVF